MRQKILPSIMAKNQQELNQDFKRLKGIVKELHLDIVDGIFARNKTLSFNFKLSKDFTYSAHLMVKNPERWISKHIKDPIYLFIPQIEELENPAKQIKYMKRNKKPVAFALKPNTKISKIKPFLKYTDYVLILTVQPGFYGSRFMPHCLAKVKDIKKINSRIKVIVDGGMHPTTIMKAKKAGADLFVSGSYTTKAKNPKESIKNLLNAMK